MHKHKNIHSYSSLYFQSIVIILLLLLYSTEPLFSQSSLSTSQKDFFSKSIVKVSNGRISTSGNIWGDMDLVLTDRYVTEGAEEFTINLTSEGDNNNIPTYKAKLFATFPGYEFAVLEITSEWDGSPVNASDLKEKPYWPSTLTQSLYLDDDEPAVSKDESITLIGYSEDSKDALTVINGEVTDLNFDLFRNEENNLVDDIVLPSQYETNAEISLSISGGLAVRNSDKRIIGIPIYIHAGQNANIDIQTGYILPFQAIWQLIELDQMLRNNIPTVRLASKQFIDPFTIELQSTGTHFDSNEPDICNPVSMSGWPDLRLYWEKQSSYLRIFFDSNPESNAVLLIEGPTGKYACNNRSHNNLNDPLIELYNPSAGIYNIWIGSYQEGDSLEGTLTITEFDYPEPD